MSFVRLAAAIAVGATVLAAVPALACDDRFPWTCKQQAPATTSEPAARDANASATTTAPKAQRATNSRKAHAARKAARRAAWKRRTKKSRSARNARTEVAESQPQKSKPGPRSTDADEEDASKSAKASKALAANDTATADSDERDVPDTTATIRPAEAPIANPAAKDPAFSGLRAPMVSPKPPAPAPAPATSSAMLAPVSSLAATTFEPPPQALPVPVAPSPTAAETEPPARSVKIASINPANAVAAAAQPPSESHGGTWIQRMLMVLGGALAAAWTTRMLVA